MLGQGLNLERDLRSLQFLHLLSFNLFLMKKIISLAFLSFNLLAIAQCNLKLSCGEFAVLFTGYQNKVEVVCPDMKSNSINVSGGTATKSSWKDKNGIDHSGYYVTVDSGVKSVSITLTGKDKNGRSVNCGSYIYNVRPFPLPQITNTTISKSRGMTINLSLGEYNPCIGAEISVSGSGIIINEYEVRNTGNTIDPSVISEIRSGKKVAIEVFYTRDGVQQGPITAILTVVE